MTLPMLFLPAAQSLWTTKFVTHGDDVHAIETKENFTVNEVSADKALHNVSRNVRYEFVVFHDGLTHYHEVKLKTSSYL